jgi:hypothetical protein
MLKEFAMKGDVVDLVAHKHEKAFAHRAGDHEGSPGAR